jgi:hypothetical protein
MRNRKTRKVEWLVSAIAAAAVTAISVPALGSAGPPVVNEHFSPPPAIHPTTWCGTVEGTAVDTIVEHYMEDANGNVIDNVRFTRVFTATATGKSIVSSAAGVAKVDITENGDGTISFANTNAGLALKFQIQNGPVLRAANGEPIRSAGVLTITDVFDAATGDYISTTESFHGPHLLREGVDICGPSVDYLMDP